MKKIFILLLFFNVLFAFNRDLLIIEAKLYSKIFMLIDNYSKKQIINVLLFSDKTEKAAFFKKLLQKGKIKVTVSKNIKGKYDIIIISNRLQKSVLKNLLKLKIPIFTTRVNDVKEAMFGIYIGVRVYPFINPYLIKKAGIEINPIIFKVAKIYEK